MRICTVSNRLLAWCSFIVVMTFGLAIEVFAQRAPTPPMQGGRTEPVYVDGSSGGNNAPSSLPWWTLPNPNIPVPGDGIGNPMGGNTGSGRGGASDCITIFRTNQCKCPDITIPERRTGIYMTLFRSGDAGDTTCPTPVIYRSSIMTVQYQASRSHSSCGHQWTQDEICQGGSYDSWIATYNWNVDLGCDYPNFNKLAIEHGIGSNFGSFKFEKHDNAPYIQIVACRGRGVQ
jgi:hypothetical protein